MNENVKRTGPPSIPHSKKKTSRLTDPGAFKQFTEGGVEKISKTGEEMKKKKRRFAQTAEEEPAQKPQAKAKPPSGDSIFAPKKSADVFGRNIPEETVSNEKVYGKPSASTVSSPPFLQGKEDHTLPSSESFFSKTSGKKGAEKKEKEGEFVPLTLKEEKAIMEAFEKKEGKKPEEKVEPAMAPTVEEPKKASSERKPVPVKKKKAQAEKPPEKKTKKKKEIEVVVPKEKEKVEKKPKEKKETKPKTKLQELAKSFSPITLLEKEKKKKKKEEVESLPTKAQPIPSDIINQAVNATTRLTPYISTEAHNLFAQMVSTVMVMQEKDVTTTQVTLTSSAFQNSVFQGATITLQRYATAPDSFNITLSGSDQAVKAFNQNIDSLHNAFARGRFPFRVGKLEASYGKSKPPLVRRKKSAREKES